MLTDEKIEYNYYPVDLGLDWKNLYNSDGNKPADGANKREIFAQNAAPTSNYKEGDLWFDADDNNTIYRANSALSWVSVKDGTIAGKTTTFRQAAIPTSLAAGDLWYDSDDSDKQYRAAAAGATTIAAGAWVRVDVGANPTLIDALATTNAPAEAAATAGANWTTNLSNIPEIRGWSHNLVFSVTDADTVAWATGTVNLPSGSNYTIDAGNTGNMAAKTYVYFDKAVSQTVLQTTTTASNAVGTNKILIAVCQNSTSEAVFQVFGGIGGLNIKGSEIEANSITANEISVNSLSALSANLGTITSGTITIDNTGHAKGGQTAYNTGTGFFLGYSTDAYKFSIGSSSNFLNWDGTYLRLKGALQFDANSVFNSASYTVANLPITPTSAGFNNPSAIDTSYSIDLESGSSQYLSITDAAQTGLDITGDMTIEAWIKIESTTATHTILGKYNSTGDQRSWYLQYNYNASGNYIRFLTSSNGSSSTLGDKTYSLSTGTWYHIAVVYTSSLSQAEIFINGSSIGTVSASSSLFNSSADFRIGAEHGGVYFDGLIDEVRVWNDVRTATEISNNYQIELTGSEANLQGYWRLNNDLLDMTSNNNDLTNNGVAVFSTDVKFTNFTNPTNAYSSNDIYATCAADSGAVKIYLSKDAGVSWTEPLSKIFTGTESSQTYGNGSTELWGTTFTGDDVDDTSFRLKIVCGSGTFPMQVYKTYGFSITASNILTGIEVVVEAKWDGATTSIDHIKVKIYYGTSIFPVSAGSVAYASNGRKNGEGVGVGTGVLVFYDGSNWIACDTGQTVAA